ncbi:hypothetical protein NE237_014588 [Protea cynaroides]|uniref:Uncharacterized protein n=1 Tax=Protea cynaroides TaxID=273540 RepID=A0A9Q0QQ82_9MAGN|nr:hypothetical protein NE237_014588 [Protea cynaroides]
MQSKLAEATIRSGGFVSALATNRVSQWIRAASSTSRTTDPTIHMGESKGIDAEDGTKTAAAEGAQQQQQHPEEENPRFPLGKVPVLPSQPKLESTEVPPPNPSFQQKRSFRASSLEDVSCVGDCDGLEREYQQQQEDDEQEYDKCHKPSPLSEVEFVDTRKPITRATDGTACADEYGENRVIGWSKEQLDTVDEALERAVRIWRENAMRGDPDSPQSRALRALLGELNS